MTTFYGQPTAATELIVREVLQGGEMEGWGLKSVEQDEGKAVAARN